MKTISVIKCPKCGLSDHVKWITVGKLGIRKTFSGREIRDYRCDNKLCSYKFKEWNAATGVADGTEKIGQPLWQSIGSIS